MMQSVGAQGYMQPQTNPSASAVNTQIYGPQAFSQPAPYQVQNPYYAYPQQSMYAQQPMGYQYQPASSPTASAVNIQIFEPKAYASPMVQPQMPAFCPQYAQFMPQQQIYQPIPQYQPSAPQAAPAEPMPQPAIAQQPEPLAPPKQEPAPQEPVAQELQPAPAPQAVQVPQAPAEQQVQGAVDVNSLIAGLQSQDNKTQEEAITKIAEYCMGEPDKQAAVLSEPIVQNLVNIINQDTSNLQGPSDAQIAALNKASTGAQLTPEEEALTKELSPKTLADKNRVISMFTLAMLQKNQRDEIDRYNQAQDSANQLPQIKMNDLIGFKEIEKAARSDSDKEVKLAALQALAYAARPEDKETLEPIVTAAMQDSEPVIQQVASEILNNMGAAPAPAAEAGAQQAQPAEGENAQAQGSDLSQMSKKEKKEYMKAQRKAEKEAEKMAKEAEKAAKKKQAA